MVRLQRGKLTLERGDTLRQLHDALVGPRGRRVAAKTHRQGRHDPQRAPHGFRRHDERELRSGMLKTDHHHRLPVGP
jgi:hypothetical protein